MRHWRKKKANRAHDFINLKNKENDAYLKLLKRIKIKVIDNPIEKALEYYYEANPDAQVISTYSNNFLLRLALNHIRHNYSNYERIIQQIGASLYHKLEFKEHVNMAIIKKYHFENLRAI